MQHRLEALRRRDLYRRVRPVPGGADPWVELDGQRLLNLSSNNYLGLAAHPHLKAAAAAAAATYGCGSGASRLIAGTFDLHQMLEERLARFKGVDGSLVFTSGYAANLAVIPALVGPGDLVLGDALNHASLIDGCRLSRAEFVSYPHNDMAALEEHLSQAVRTGQRGRRLVVTDTVFSMDGDVAPLADIAQLCEAYRALLLVDEAHATGCLGPGGRGLVAQVGVADAVTVSMSTFSKALGSCGAFVGGADPLKDYLVNVARGFIYTTALPPPVIAASLAALDVLDTEPERTTQLQANAALFRQGLQALGFNTMNSATQIIPVLVGDAGKTVQMAAALRDAGIFAVAIRPPTVPLGAARIRASVMAVHTPDELLAAVETFGRVGHQMGLL